MTVEREIGSIESANINKETLDAMKNASKAIQNIHGGLTVDQVDQTMEDLREQHAVGEEIAEALTQGAQTSGVDEDELDEELAELQQEALDERMLKTGSVPVHDQIQRMPNAPSKFLGSEIGGRCKVLTCCYSKEHSHGRRRRRGGRATEAAGRDGHVRWRLEVRCSSRGVLSILNPCETEFCIHALRWISIYSEGCLPLDLLGGALVFAVLASVSFSLESEQATAFLLNSYPCSHELQTTVKPHCKFHFRSHFKYFEVSIVYSEFLYCNLGSTNPLLPTWTHTLTHISSPKPPQHSKTS
jgi:hypothetical protein